MIDFMVHPRIFVKPTRDEVTFSGEMIQSLSLIYSLQHC